MAAKILTLRQRDRIARLMPGGVPRWIRVYDNTGIPGESCDCITVIYSGRAAPERSPGNPTQYPYRAMSRNPFHPQGVGMYGSCQMGPADTRGNKGDRRYAWPPAMGRRCSLGRRIPFTKLNAAQQLCAMQDYIEIWRLPKQVLEPYQRRYRRWLNH